jgi:hypothetical protein
VVVPLVRGLPKPLAENVPNPAVDEPPKLFVGVLPETGNGAEPAKPGVGETRSPTPALAVAGLFATGTGGFLIAF